MIYKYILIVLGLYLFCTTSVTYALQMGRVENSVSVDYTKVDIENALKIANENFDKAIKENDKEKKESYLGIAVPNYNIYVSAHPEDIKAVIKLARAYDMQKRDRQSKAIFFQALGINSQDVWANYYFGDFFYRREEYRKALYYFREALKNGLEETPDNMKQMAIIYEKFGDLYRANIYYKTLYIQNPSDEFVADKIRELEGIKYQDLNYYRSGTSK